ncbi:transmembrane glycoprotein NMB [Rousettus aegyptiacus]|uniref:Transmembrane glycoprotein NMB n=1 Tax=Rousettus aegyptiacus TaxID=9407 RepID=A0A7J8D673_ROUAE|nr:transmembrane glycoprotein NMB [Rousettus aegyptiacus]XP_036086299.1 transmembrane glycoprotein NMB [Rousettus aegyptiacus]KAF6418442.1 glycoprotein nmb [Rousettus aegyptiacus]
MECLCCFLGFLLLAARLPLDAAKRFHEVLSNERTSGYIREHNQLKGWSSDENDWNEELYPVWKRGDPRWKNSWKGGHVQVVLTSDSPALVGSNITFMVKLAFPRCQKEDADGSIVYEKNCRNETGPSPDPYVYNWTAWTEDGDWGNGTNQSHHVFPDGRPFPHHHGWRKMNFVYMFHTLGQYFQKLGRCSLSVSINTTNMTLGPQLMEVTVYRRHRRSYVPMAKVKTVYVVTDQIPISVNMSQKNNRNSSDEIFLRDLPITFNVLIHDPSHFLNESAIHYKWNFGDGSGLFVTNNHTLNHTYVLNGTYSFNLTVQTAVPGPCPPPTPRPPKPTLSSLPAGDNPLELWETPGEDCQINRYGYFKATVTIVDGILEVNIIQMTSVQIPPPQPDSSLMDFVVTCHGTIPTEVCTVISDPTCQIAQGTFCNPVDVGDMCLLTVRRAFNGSGTYCMNLTLGDNASLALTSTLVSIPGRDSGSPSRMVNGVLVSVGCVAILVTVIALLVYKKHKEYKPVENSTGIKGKGLNVFLNHAKAKFFSGSQEKDPLLRNQPGSL